jgi:hypothetical protein
VRYLKEFFTVSDDEVLALCLEDEESHLLSPVYEPPIYLPIYLFIDM